MRAGASLAYEACPFFCNINEKYLIYQEPPDISEVGAFHGIITPIVAFVEAAMFSKP